LSDHLTQTQIVDYGRRPLPPAEWLFVSDHLAVCEGCRRQVEEVVDNEATYLALKSGVFDEAETRSSVAEHVHLTFEQMAGFVDETVANGNLQVVKEHLAWCEECETAADDLRAFKEQVTPELEREGRLSPMGAATENRWHRLIAAMASFRPKSPALVFGSALAILLLAVGWLGWQALRGMKSKPEVAVTAPSPSVSPSVLPASTPESSAAVIIARFNDGEGQITLDEEGKLSGVDHLPSAYRRMIKKALTNQRIERSLFLAESSPPGVRWRGGFPSGGRDWVGSAQSSKFSVIEPVGVVILSDHPTFRWTRLDGATGYVVEVYDEWLNPLVTSPQITDPSWTAAQSLKRGGIYYWQVKTIKNGQEFKAPRPPAPQAKFRILDEATAGELAKARRTYSSSHLTLGLLYAQAGLLDEAELEFQALLKNNPDSALGRRLLRQVRTKP
jgi:predicted anti-sigma-YlaC factor YlaD